MFKSVILAMAISIYLIIGMGVVAATKARTETEPYPMILLWPSLLGAKLYLLVVTDAGKP